MSDFTFLEEGQITGNDKLEIFEKYDTSAAITDFAILLGGYVSNDNYTSEGNLMSNRTGIYWTKTSHKQRDAVTISSNGVKKYSEANCREVCGRPAVNYSSIKQNILSSKITPKNILEVQYGAYPQTVVDEIFATTLEVHYQERLRTGNMIDTGNAYTTDSAHYDDYGSSMSPRTFNEYEYKGQRYIRFKGEYNSKGEYLSNNKEILVGKTYWIKVEPIVWLVDEKANIAITKKAIFAGVQFNVNRNYQGDFDNTDIKNFMDNYFSNEITQNNNLSFLSYDDIEIESEKPLVSENKRNKKANPYKFETKKVSEEEIISGAIKSNIPVFLHGKSGVGKSARVKQLDPDYTIVYLRNATPDSLNGKSVNNQATGEMKDIPPTWYKKLKEKCENEPDKLHILFFDEISNALPSIQGMAFNIILDKEVNGIWRLPSNTRIVAAGNDVEDSLAAHQLAEPLFNRFAHVYIDTTADKWLKWAAKSENHIHPAIYAYIAYKESIGMGDKTLISEFDGSKPNADPRKWEMASKLLYATGKPTMLEGLLGISITIDFFNFCNQNVITIEGIKSENAKNYARHMKDDSEKFATVLNLSKCKEEDLEIARDFISELGAAPLATFDILWSHGDENRLEQIATLRLESATRKR